MLRERMHHYRQRLEQALDRRLPDGNRLPEQLHQAMRYSALDGGGKRMRPVLVYAAGELLGADSSDLDTPACAVELIHAYSLIHDDLPAMDDDALRRGRPTLHRAFDEATAILAGDALQSLAFQLLAQDEMRGVSAERRLEMIRRLALASGSRGMCGGQALDLAATGQEITLAELEDLHIHKTGALIRAAVTLGALAAPTADPVSVSRLDHFAKCIGLAFQIRDDILDVEGETSLLGKETGADAAHAKATYPSLLGMKEAREHGQALLDEALEALSAIPGDTRMLAGLARFTVERMS